MNTSASHTNHKSSSGAETSAGAFIRREPLVHFLGLAALLFVFNAIFSGDERELISVDVATQEYLVQQRQELMLRDLTEQEKSEVVETFIEEEILVREGRKRGYENSSRIRTLLMQNMRFFMTSDVPNPGEDDLRTFFNDNIERFTTPPTVTYGHVFFSDPDSVPADILDSLRQGTDIKQIGDADIFNNRLTRAGETMIISNFGREQTSVIQAIGDEQWHGPFSSANGVHFLRVIERHPAMRPSFESAGNWLEQEWRSEKSREIVAREMDDMRKNYRIEVLQKDSTDE